MHYRFLADCMLGRLCKWLRIAGFDSEYMADAQRDFNAIVSRLIRDKSLIFLTRDTKILPYSNIVRFVFFRQQHWKLQLLHLTKELKFELDREKYFTRCLLCNVLLEEIPKEKAEKNAPELVREKGYVYHACPQCGKVYWPGTHLENVRQELSKLLSY